MALTMPDWARNAAYRVLHSLSGPGDSVSVILLYHSLGTGISSSLPLDRFEEQLELLAERFRVVRLDELRTARASSPDANLAVITFDDGFLDNFEIALPALERYRVPATFFVATGYLGGRFRTSVGELPMMDAAQVKELSERGHEIGAHTMTHPKLTRMDPAAVRDEMRGSRDFLESALGKRVVSFAYPKGDYNTAVRNAAEEEGFQIAVTIEERLVDRDPDWLALPRVWISNRLSAGAFRAKLSPAVGWYQDLSRRASRMSVG